MPSLFVLLPAYNEAATVGKVVKAVLAQPLVQEVIVVDDGSTDGTWGQLQELGKEDRRIRLFRHDNNQGKGAALRTGFRQAAAPIVVVQDADLEYDPQDCPRVVGPILEGKADVVFGSRFEGGGPQFIECDTYRYGGHSMAAPGSYRPAVEVKAQKAWDPISAAIREVELRYPTQAELAEVGPDNIGQLTAHMVAAGHLADADLEDLKKEVQAIVEDAAQFALQSPQPTMEAAWAHMNCNRHHEVLI